MGHTVSVIGLRAGAMLVAMLAVAPVAAEQASAEDAALAVLVSARRAYNEGQFAQAIERFRTFLKSYPNHPQAAAAQYGLALSILEGPEKDYRAAAEALRQAVGREGLADRPLAHYYLGLALRGLAEQSLAEAAAKPAEAKAHQAAAAQKFDEAAASFAAAVAGLQARAKTPGPGDTEWVARARCDQAEMLLRLNRFKEAADAVAPLLADPAAPAVYRPWAIYLLGYARFGLKDYVAAGRALSQLAPFKQKFGVHAQYLLARVHHLMGERAEAAGQYAAVLAGYDEQKKAAQESLKNPAALQPGEKAALEALLNSPPPDYIGRSTFYAALLLAEDGRFGEALDKFTAFVRSFPNSPLVPEANLRLGFCQLQTKNYKGAIATLGPLVDHPQLGDQAMRWLARSQLAAADPANAQAVQETAKAAIDLLRRAADKAAALAKTDPDAKARRADVLMELAEAQQLARQFNEAAATYRQVGAEAPAGARAEEALQREAAAVHLAGRFAESDEICRRFEKNYPRSVLLPAVLFCSAENAYLAGLAAAADPARASESTRMLTDAVSRYQRVVKQFPEYPQVNLARQAMGMALYRLGRYADAIAAMSAIPDADRIGDLATVPYLLADCHLRLLPPETDDAVQAARLIDQSGEAAKLLQAFLAAQGQSPLAPDAMLKLGYTHQRVGGVLADPAERQKTFTVARETYERLIQQFPKDPAMPWAVFERAKVLAVLGDPDAAVNELRRFQADPLRGSPVAPLAAVRLSSLLRARGKAAEAAVIMADCRAQHEQAVSKDPARSPWAPVILYEHALAVMESGKPAEARAMFETLARQYAGSGEALNALWRAGQCQRDELAAQLAAAAKTLAAGDSKPEQVAAAREASEAALRLLRQTAAGLVAQADGLAKKVPGSAAHLRLLYEAAWCHRLVADAEIESARQKLQRQALERARAKAPKDAPAPMQPPEVALAAVSIQPAEEAAHDVYKALVAAAPESPLAVQARFELAEMHARREDTGAAMTLLAEALENNPPPELAERIRLRLAAVCLARKDPKAALAHLAAAKGPASPRLAAEAKYLAGEAAIQQQDWAKAIEHLRPFLDQEPLRHVSDISDRALLRLGHAYAQAGQWEPSRQVLQTLLERYPQSQWADEARYGVGLALQNLKQHDGAVQAYAEVVKHTVAEVAAKAQVQIGLCRLDQQRPAEAVAALLVVPYTYGYPECSALAWCEAGRAYVELKQPAEAVKAWERVVREYPKSRWAEVARQRLAQMK